MSTSFTLKFSRDYFQLTLFHRLSHISTRGGGGHIALALAYKFMENMRDVSACEKDYEHDDMFAGANRLTAYHFYDEGQGDQTNCRLCDRNDF